jgi:hypothetical protein
MEATPSSTSASPEAVDKAFVGLDPDDTEVIKVGGAEFTLGVLPSAMWDMVQMEAATVYNDARRRLIAELPLRGINPEDVVQEGGTVTQLMVAIIQDEKYLSALYAIQLRAVKYGLRSHKNFRTRKREVPLKFEDEVVDGLPCRTLTKEVMGFYAINPLVVQSCWVALTRLNQIGDVEKKV